MGRHTGTIAKKFTGAITKTSGIVPAAMCAAAFGAILTIPTIASAEPKQYDPDAEANCEGAAASRYLNGEIGMYEYIGQVEECCIDNGGIPDDHHVCHAVADVRPGRVPPAVLPPGGVPTLTAVPTTSTPSTVNVTPAPITRG